MFDYSARKKICNRAKVLEFSVTFHWGKALQLLIKKEILDFVARDKYAWCTLDSRNSRCFVPVLSLSVYGKFPV